MIAHSMFPMLAIVTLGSRRRYLPLLQHVLAVVLPDLRLSNATEELQGVHQPNRQQGLFS
jgi:hypothetical protein